MRIGLQIFPDFPTVRKSVSMKRSGMHRISISLAKNRWKICNYWQKKYRRSGLRKRRTWRKRTLRCVNQGSRLCRWRMHLIQRGHIANPPYGLYVKGCLPQGETVAIVGARMCSEYGRTVARELGRMLAARGVGVVSGMARGIDAAGHQGALDVGGISCAVLGCGVDVCYPKSSRVLYEEILERGSVVSEYPPGTQPIPGYFPQRNRIISGLVRAVVVVEAKQRSGSLITADFALEQGRDVYAIPGRITDALSAGCNSLIRQGAGAVSDLESFVQELAPDPGAGGETCTFEKLLLEKEERLVYSCVDLRPKSMEELLEETDLSVPELAQILGILLKKGFVTEAFKNCYIRRI